MNFKSGDTVQLKSGGLIMTIEDIDGDSANCVWFIDNKVERSNFYLTTLNIFQMD